MLFFKEMEYRNMNKLKATVATVTYALILSNSANVPASQISVLANDFWYNFAASRIAEGEATGCLVNTCLTPAPNSIFADLPSWDFTGAHRLDVTDAFDTGDIFDIYDNGVLIGTTSFSTVGAFDRYLNPDDAMLDTAYSSGSFLLGEGNHSITIFNNIETTQLGGTAYFRISEVSAIPVPAAVWLFGSGLIGLAGIARRKKA